MHRPTEEIEIDLLLEAVYQQWGYDFREYSRASLTRRLRDFQSLMGVEHLSQLIPLVLHDRQVFAGLVENISVTVTEMFRDPFVYKTIRQVVIPYLRTFPSLNIWVAGCATGEEVYSLAILLKEEGIYDRCRIYATDMNENSLAKAKEGIFPSQEAKLNTANYHKAGGLASFNEYYRSRYDKTMISKDLRERVLFDTHNLASDGAFNKMHLIMCRNVLIYFTKHLQDRVLRLFEDSLCNNGFLVLGTKEELGFSSVGNLFKTIAKQEKIFQKGISL